ncbi:MAG TPA: sigma-70 family RNA polymerase sigma factor [Blastocatellia bacterium]
MEQYENRTRGWAERFESSRPHLRAVAYRMLGSGGEAEDAVQESWLRLSRADVLSIDNLEGWLTTVVARVCLDMLRSRKSRREDPPARQEPDPAASNPEQEAQLAESVGLALLVVLDRLAPAERVAFILHDVFGVSFDDVAPVVERSTTAARQLASRARRRVRATGTVSDAHLSEQKAVVDAFLTAVRTGDFDALVAVLDPDVVRRADAAVLSEAARELRGARAVAEEALKYKEAARCSEPVLVNGSVGFLVAPGGRLRTAISCNVKGGKIVEMDVIAEPTSLDGLKVMLLDET